MLKMDAVKTKFSCYGPFKVMDLNFIYTLQVLWYLLPAL